MGSADQEGQPSDAYRPVDPPSAFGTVLGWIVRSSKGELELAFGRSPRSDQRVGLLRRATRRIGMVAVGGAALGTFLSLYRGERVVGPHPWSDSELLWASVGIRATLTFLALMVPLFITFARRRNVAEKDHQEWIARSRAREKRARFAPDPRSQPRPSDLGVPALVCGALSSGIWLTFW